MGRRIPGRVSESVVNTVVVSFTICLLLIRVFKGGLCGPWGRCVAAVFCKLLISWLFQKMDIP